MRNGLLIAGLVTVVTLGAAMVNSGGDPVTPAKAAPQMEAKNPDIIQLSSRCPAGFAIGDYGEGCEFQSLYSNYTSLQGQGLGGLQDGLPDIRDGFDPKVIDLGRYLFFDPILSKGGQMSCATCHDPAKGFSDGLDRSIGLDGEKVTRSAPSLWNVGFLDRLFWDARANTLEEQAEGPLYNVHEMANTKENLIKDINAVPLYRELFADAYGGQSSDPISEEQIYVALAAFQSTLVSFNSRYDQYAHGYHEALTEKEIEGLNLFRSFVARCSECHTPPLFTNKQTATIGTPEPDGMPYDVGAEKTYNNSTMRGSFKVPTLRNIAKSAPYMHSGRFTKLRDAVEFYNLGRGHAVPEEHKDTVRVHWHIWDPKLKASEIDRLVDFLGTLTDESFMPSVPVKVPSGLPLVSAEAFQHKIKQQQQASQQLGQDKKTRSAGH